MSDSSSNHTNNNPPAVPFADDPDAYLLQVISMPTAEVTTTATSSSVHALNFLAGTVAESIKEGCDPNIAVLYLQAAAQHLPAAAAAESSAPAAAAATRSAGKQNNGSTAATSLVKGILETEMKQQMQRLAEIGEVCPCPLTLRL